VIRRIVVGAAILVVAAIALVLAIAMTKPDEFVVQRSVRIKAAPEKVYPRLVDCREWPAWSPWEKLDPAIERSLSGPASGPGAVYAWKGNRDVGRGRMEIKDAQAPSRVSIQLDFIEPFEARNRTEFTLVPGADATEVTWRMSGPSPHVTKVMSVFFDMDAVIGKDFEAGLANLKAASER